MGHLVGKDLYRELGRKIDGLSFRVPWSEKLRAVLEELYTEEEALVVSRMPASSLSTFDEVRTAVGFEEGRLRGLLAELAHKGLVVDVFLNGEYRYGPSPFVIGIFEFTMMRTDGGVDFGKVAGLFKELFAEGGLFGANFDGARRMGLMRTLPYEESLPPEDALPSGPEGEYVEVLDYEKAAAVVDAADLISLGTCSCRHEKLHHGEACDAPLETCTSFGMSADYLIRNGLARKAEKAEMLEVLARSKELGLVLNADNVKRSSQFICHCCKCCCNVLLGVREYGFPDIVVTSSYIVELDPAKCSGCGACERACGSGAIRLGAGRPEEAGAAAPDQAGTAPAAARRHLATVDPAYCLGCGVCVTRCPSGALRMVKRAPRYIHPETTFEKAILGGLERGTLQDLIAANPRRLDQRLLLGLVGGFLRLSAVKRALMSDALRSGFLGLFKTGARLSGRGWLTQI